MKNNSSKLPPPRRVLPILEKMKGAYALWYEYYQVLPKVHKYSLGQKIDNLFIEIIESMANASFLNVKEKLPWIRLAIRKLDTLKILLMILWENRSLNNKRYVALSLKLEEVGKMLGGWSGQTERKLSQQ